MTITRALAFIGVALVLAPIALFGWVLLIPAAIAVVVALPFLFVPALLVLISRSSEPDPVEVAPTMPRAGVVSA